MSIMKQAFGWVIGIKDESLDSLDIAGMEQKIRATNRMRDQWDREIQKAEKEYQEAVSIEANAGRSPIARKLAIQNGAGIAKRIKTLASASGMLTKMGGLVEQLKMLKKFYNDMIEVQQLPKGLTVEGMIRQIYTMSDVLADKKGRLDDMIASLDSANKSISAENEDQEIEKLMNDLNGLYDEYNTKLALNDTQAAEEVKRRIELKKAEVDKQMGIASIA